MSGHHIRTAASHIILHGYVTRIPSKTDGSDIVYAMDINAIVNKIQTTNATNVDYLTRFEHVINVKNYGALGDGTNDDLPAIVLAVNAASQGDIVYFPIGIYRTYGTAGSFSITKPVNIVGRSASGTRLKNIFPRISLSPVATYREVFSISNLTIGSSSTYTSGQIGIDARGMWNMRITNVHFDNMERGIGINAVSGYYAYGTRIEKCIFNNNRWAIRLNSDPVSYVNNQPNVTRIVDSDFQYETDATFYQSGNDAIVVNKQAYSVDVWANHFFGHENVVKTSLNILPLSFLGNYVESCKNVIGSDSAGTFRTIKCDLRGNSITNTTRYFNYISLSMSEVQPLLGGTIGSPLIPNNAVSEWTTTWCRIPSTTALVKGINNFTYRSSDRSISANYGTYNIQVRNTGGITTPFSLTASDQRDASFGNIGVVLTMSTSITLTSDFDFSIQLIYP